MVKLRRYRDDLIVLALLVGGFWLNLAAPIWLAPPLFPYTIWLYLCLFFAWIPVYILLMRHKQRGARLTLVVLLGALLSSFMCMVFVPRSSFGITFLDTIRCEVQDAPEGRVRYACVRPSFDGPEYTLTYILDGLQGLPILTLTDVQRGQ